MAERMSVDKKDLVKDDSEESMGSSPDAEHTTNNNGNHNSNNTAAQENQQPKRKGGRKPIYATSEERKQRNRQAQAAFRERRTEYIKQLEETIRVHEQNLHSLQAAHRHAADECLMLRYKNSLLERILLEKGIDVQAELRAKTGSPNLGPTQVPQTLVQPPPIQRAMLNRHHARRSNSSIAPKLEPGINLSPRPPPLQSNRPQSSAASPKTRPTPPSHSASPTATTFGSQHVASPAGSVSENMTSQIRPPLKAQPPQVGAMAGMAPTTTATRQMQMVGAQPAATAAQSRVRPGVSAASFYTTPAFQNHIEQLEQEYDVAADMMDDHVESPDTPSGPGPYPGAAFGDAPQPMTLSSPVTSAPPGGQQMSGPSAMDGVTHTQHSNYPSMTQLLDPGLDWDPFGLSASMAFPTQFSFDTSNMR
ncbi:hypothetical protein QBC33DRAFT_126269 [Phialemonium atrogriseum]|uniref:BZIP domain-containing protein n=1 Tax=Phialemonium atrogriseum TaxID=1093897 RepID=A0AAJ0BW98_9PEZI|nr:uncharacterized protein QBC33DRAFT_126269 [Phialemonium atrogriseum]KAK1765635.1 hypothetical protein QBC33DRAFT_126269 [Phialemonium atrogriseum]